MESQNIPTEGIRLMLPPIPFDQLPERTKDFILAKTNEKGCSSMEAVVGILDQAAAKAGFRKTKPKPAALAS